MKDLSRTILECKCRRCLCNECIKYVVRYVVEKKELSNEQQVEINNIICSLQDNELLVFDYFIKDKANSGSDY